MVHRPLGRALGAVLLVGGLSWGMVACGDDSSSGAGTAATPTDTATATPTASPECADLAALEDSLNALADVDVKRDGVEALTTAIAQVKTDLATAQSSVSDALKPEVQAVASAFDALTTAASGLTTDNLVDKAPAIATALDRLSTAVTDLVSAVTQTWPGD